MSFSILHISDTHLSPRTEHFRANNDMLSQMLRAAPHDCVIHTGDITLDGIRYEEDYVLCRALLEGIGREIRYIPGNHDIGDNPRLSKPAEAGGSGINAERLNRFKSFYESDRFAFDRDGWRIIGINSMLIGSGLPEEQEQYDWIDGQLATLDLRHLAVFSHQPLYIDAPDDTELTYWTVDPAGWPRLAPLMNHPQLRLIASGHLHQQRSRKRNGVALEWCSSIAFTTTEELVPEMGGSRRVGYMEHTLHDDGTVSSRVHHVDGFANTHLEDVIKEVYPLI